MSDSRKTLYAITVQVETVTIGSGDTAWRGSVQVPTFYLDADVQGIVSEDHAARIASTIINPLGEIPAERIHVSAVALTVASYLA
jgi:hypothetical protein